MERDTLGRIVRQHIHPRFWPKVDKAGPVPDYAPGLGPCWLWVGATNKHGYGRFNVKDARVVMAHRFAYELWLGPIPDGLTLDHLCRVRNCVNPGHLEPVTIAENVMRGEGVCATHSRKTHCVKGHDLNDPANATRNARGHRRCLVCHRDWMRASWQRKRAQVAS